MLSRDTISLTRFRSLEFCKAVAAATKIMSRETKRAYRGKELHISESLQVYYVLAN